MAIPPSSGTPFTRRDFIARTGLSAVAAALLPAALSNAASAQTASVGAAKSGFQIAAFEKHFFESYTPEQIAQTCDEMDLDLELTVRPEGHIKPENVPNELPVMVAALAKRNRRILVLASSFVRPDDPHLEQVLQTAKQLGIAHYRHRGFSYKPDQPIRSQVANFKSQARELAAIHKEAGVVGLYQNHAGANSVGAAIWDIDEILGDIDPKYFALALDTRHLVVELGQAWPTAVRLIAPRVGSLYVKSFRWERDHPVETPLSEGILTRSVTDPILAGRTGLPICLHIEHLPLKPVPFADRASTVQAFRADAAVLRGWLASA